MVALVFALIGRLLKSLGLVLEEKIGERLDERCAM